MFTAEPGEGERWHWSVAILASLISVLLAYTAECGKGREGCLECANAVYLTAVLSSETILCHS